MEKPIINSFSPLTALSIQPYEAYLPVAFDDQMTMLQKVNKMIVYCNQIGKLTNEVVAQWNDVMEWIMNDGLSDAVITRLNELIADGTLAQIINEEIFGELNAKIGSNLNFAQWLQTSLYSIAQMHDNYLRNDAIDITLPPYNAKADAKYRDDLTGKWYQDVLLTIPATPMSDILNQAIQDLKLTGKRKIRVPSGYYYLDKPITLIAGLRITGGGMHYQEEFGTVFRLDGDYHAFTTGLIESDVIDMRSVVLEHFVVKGNAMAPSSARTNYGLNAVHMRYNVELNQVGFKYFKYGMYLNNVWKANFNNVLTNYCLIGVYLESQCNRVSFYECEFNRNDESAVRISPYGLKSESVLFIGCLIEKNNGHGIRIANCEAVTIMNCYIEGNHWNSVLIDPVGDDYTTEVGTVNIMNNRFFGNSNYSYANNAIYIDETGTKNVRINGNHFRFFKDAVIRMYLDPLMQVDVDQNFWSETPNFISYLNAIGNKPIVRQAGYFNLNNNVLRGAVLQGFYDSARPTDDLKEGYIIWSLTQKKFIAWNGTDWVNLDGTPLV